MRSSVRKLISLGLFLAVAVLVAALIAGCATTSRPCDHPPGVSLTSRTVGGVTDFGSPPETVWVTVHNYLDRTATVVLACGSRGVETSRRTVELRPRQEQDFGFTPPRGSFYCELLDIQLGFRE